MDIEKLEEQLYELFLTDASINSHDLKSTCLSYLGFTEEEIQQIGCTEKIAEELRKRKHDGELNMEDIHDISLVVHNIFNDLTIKIESVDLILNCMEIFYRGSYEKSTPVYDNLLKALRTYQTTMKKIAAEGFLD
ncbi:MAG: hypothetical protein SVO01_00375 [Thermotogota bacterium]|nr:hypothetical protein [Thermotogota bacterium]